MGKTPTKEERLAAALRDNLKRRKAQSRESSPNVDGRSSATFTEKRGD